MAQKQYRIADINLLDRDAFMAVFESVFEGSAWAAELVYEHLPFASVDSFTDRFCQCVSEADDQAKFQLLCAHPELGSNRMMADASVKEQTGAGIRDTKQDHRSLLQELNALYRQQFDFPFIIAVKGLTPALIVEQMQQRLLNDRDTEFDECLKQVFKIARIRLDDILTKE